MRARSTFVCFYRVAYGPSALQHPSGVEHSDAPAGPAVLRVLPKVPRKNQNAATAGCSPAGARRLAATPCRRSDRGEGAARGDALVHDTAFLLLVFRRVFPACLPRHRSPMDFSSPAVSVFTSDRAKCSF